MRILPVLALISGLAAAQSGGPRLAPNKGLPSAKGLGKTVILSNWAKSEPQWKAVKEYAKLRQAKILRFEEHQVFELKKKLARIGPEYVAVLAKPETVGMNFQLSMLELCRNLDDDPMPDFYFGYLCARDGHDLMDFVRRIVSREQDPKATHVAKVEGMEAPGGQLAQLDYLLHFGHGQPWRVDQGLTGEQLGKLELPRGPVVFSGACFNGVLSWSYHRCAYELVYMPAQKIAPEQVMSLNWVRAGATGLLAALEGDRGEMAIAEWDYFRERACPLGEVIGYQYRLAFTSLPADFKGFPRYRPRVKKRMSFYDVMLRGMISRILLSDPVYRPLKRPLIEPVTAYAVKQDEKAKTLTVTIICKRWEQGQLLNYLPKSPSDKFDRRLYRRVELPPALKGTLGDPAVTVIVRGNPIQPTQVHVRHEAWGGKRYVNLQVEAPPGTLGVPGATATYVFPVR